MYQSKWHFPNPDLGKKYSFKILGERFKEHKSRLNRDYVQTGKLPFDKYSNISEEDWEIFVRQRGGQAFQV